jgi:hypothetical protein
MTDITSTREILTRLNEWEEKHYADPESVWDIWQEVILELPDYDGEATAASSYATTNAGFLTSDGREFAMMYQQVYSPIGRVATVKWICIEPREGE